VVDVKVDEHNFIDLIKSKNESGLDYLIDEYGWIIKTVLKKELATYPDLYDETFNDCLLFVWNKIDGYDPLKSKFPNWLGMVAKYRSIDAKRKFLKKASRELSMDTGIVSLEDHKPGQIDGVGCLEREARAGLVDELDGDIKSLLDRLSPTNRQIFWDRYVEDYGIDELSEKYKLSKQAIYNRLARSRDNLKLMENGGSSYERK